MKKVLFLLLVAIGFMLSANPTDDYTWVDDDPGDGDSVGCTLTLL